MTIDPDRALSAQHNSGRDRRSWADLQGEIYRRGLEGITPGLPTNLLELEALAIRELSDEARGYIVSSAGDSNTARENRTALDRWRIVPTMLAGVTERSTEFSLLGQQMVAPVIVAPVGVQTLAHPEGELATARAAAALGITYIHSQAASYSYEDVAAAAPKGQRWSQFYRVTDDDVCVSMLERAAAAGHSHLVITVDTLMLGWRPADLDRGYLPFLKGIGIANYASDPAFLSRVEPHRRTDPSALAEEWLQIFPNPGMTWSELEFLRANWAGPILIKGICNADDALRAIDHGMDGVIVSNHGGRQVDGALGAIDSLPGVVAAVDGRCPVLFDSGVRTGVDVFRAIALGAASVLVGRAFLFGLALGGQVGVEHVLSSLLAEFDLTLALTGHRTHLDIRPNSLRHVS